MLSSDPTDPYYPSSWASWASEHYSRTRTVHFFPPRPRFQPPCASSYIAFPLSNCCRCVVQSGSPNSLFGVWFIRSPLYRRYNLQRWYYFWTSPFLFCYHPIQSRQQPLRAFIRTLSELGRPRKLPIYIQTAPVSFPLARPPIQLLLSTPSTERDRTTRNASTDHPAILRVCVPPHALYTQTILHGRPQQSQRGA